jgi:hypothetical protein
LLLETVNVLSAVPGILAGFRSEGRGSTAVYDIFDPKTLKMTPYLAVDVTFHENLPAQPVSAGQVEVPTVPPLPAANPTINQVQTPQPQAAITLMTAPTPAVPQQCVTPVTAPNPATTVTTVRRSMRSNIGVPPPRLAFTAETVSTEALYAFGSGGEDVEDDELAAQIRFQLPILLNEAFSADGATVPTSFQEAIASPQSEKWLAAAAEEYQSLVDRKVFKIVTRPTGGKIFKCMWVFSLKTNADGTIERYKARLVAKGFMQTYEVDYNETWAPTGRATLRVLFALAAQYGWDIWGFDVSSAFLNAELHDQVYMEQPVGFRDGSSNVYQLLRPIYGLKQLLWNPGCKRTTLVFSLC